MNDAEPKGEKLKRLGLLCKTGELDVGIRVLNMFMYNDIHYVYELVTMTKSELLSFPNFGRKSLKEVEDVLSSAGFRLGMTLPPMETNYE